MNKELSLIALFAFIFAQPSFAKDLEMGTVEVFGNSTFNKSNKKYYEGSGPTDEWKTTEIDVTPIYYLQKNFGIGIKFSQTKYSEDGYNSSQTLISPGASFNVSIDESSSIALSAAMAGLIQGEYKSHETGFPEYSVDISGTILQAAFKKFLSPNISLNFSLTSTKLKGKPNTGGDDIHNDSTDYGAGLSVYF